MNKVRMSPVYQYHNTVIIRYRYCIDAWQIIHNQGYNNMLLPANGGHTKVLG